MGSDALANVLLPLGYVAGFIRTTVIAVLALLYVILVKGTFALLVCDDLAGDIHMTEETSLQYRRCIESCLVCLLPSLAGWRSSY